MAHSSARRNAIPHSWLTGCVGGAMKNSRPAPQPVPSAHCSASLPCHHPLCAPTQLTHSCVTCPAASQAATPAQSQGADGELRLQSSRALLSDRRPLKVKRAAASVVLPPRMGVGGREGVGEGEVALVPGGTEEGGGSRSNAGGAGGEAAVGASMLVRQPAGLPASLPR